MSRPLQDVQIPWELTEGLRTHPHGYESGAIDCGIASGDEPGSAVRILLAEQA